MNKKAFLIFLLFLSLITYHSWLSFNIFESGDWSFYYPEVLKFNLNPSVWSSLGNFGSLNLVLWRYSISFFQGLFGVLGYGSNVSEKFLVFWPTIILANLATFLLVRKITKSSLAGFIGAIVFNYNTYYFTIASAFLLYSRAAWAVLTFYLFIHALEKKKLFWFLISGLTLFITGAYDFRVVYIELFLLGFYFLFFNLFIEKFQKKAFLKNFFFFSVQGIIFGLLNLYWILAFINARSLVSNSVLQRGLFGSEFSNILYSITLFHPFWTGTQTAYFNPQPVFAYFWLIPVFAFLGLYLNRKNKNILFFGLLTLLGVFLTKQVGIPFKIIYQWLFDNFPGFNAFREASKFYFIVVLGYSVLIGGLVNWVWENFKNGKYRIYGKYLLTGLIFVIFIWNVKPILTGEIQNIFVPRVIRKEYLILRNYIQNQAYFYRTLWIPYPVSWSEYSAAHPIVLGAYIYDNDWSKIFSKYQEDPLLTSGQRMIDFLKKKESQNLLDLSSIKYVVIPREDTINKQNIFPNYGQPRQFYINNLIEIPWLKGVDIGTGDSMVYENQGYKPHIYSTLEKESIYKPLPPIVYDTKYSFVNASQYKIIVKNATEPFYLNFSESYNPQWKLYLGQFNWLNVILNKQPGLSDSEHFKTDATLNSFRIDPEGVCRVESCKVNKDGSYDIRITLYFAPQSYLYLGLIMGGSTLILVIGYLIVVAGRTIYEKRH